MARRPGQGKIRQEASGIRPLKSAGACKDDERARTRQKEVNPLPAAATLASNGWSLERRPEGSAAGHGGDGQSEVNARPRQRSAAAACEEGRPSGHRGWMGSRPSCPPFVFESTRFGPWAKLRSGASFKTGRPGPFAGLVLLHKFRA